MIAEPAIYIALDYLLERLPPQMRLVVGARHDPPLALPRLRARGQLAELRVGDLRFTLDETATFLNETLRLGLSPDDLTTLQNRTEGWPVGLRLLAGSLTRIPTPAGRTAFIAHLAQTGRHIFGFLADEVLSRQSPAVRTFLLETSILSELTPALCQAVTGRSDAEAMLEDLDRRSLFIAAVNRPPHTPTLPHPHTSYRYHALFAEFLRRQLAQEMPERAPELHRRAAEAQAAPDHAIGHYLAAEMWEQAAQAIEQVGEQLLHQGLLDTLIGWIRALPTPLREAHPDLAWLLGHCALLKGEFEVAQSLLERVLRDYEAAGDELRGGGALTYLALSALLQADFERASTLIQRALAHPLPPHSRVSLLMGRASLDLALDAANVPHVVYHEHMGDPLYHATPSTALRHSSGQGSGQALGSTTWVTRQVDTPGDAWPRPSIGADAAGTAHVAYMAKEGGNLAVRHAAFDGSTWATETLVIAGPDEWDHLQAPPIGRSGRQGLRPLRRLHRLPALAR